PHPVPLRRLGGLWRTFAQRALQAARSHRGDGQGRAIELTESNVMRPPLRVGTVYDFRNTPESGMDMPSLYAAIMDQVVMLDRLGLDLVWFTEHHFLDDGYLPSWVPMAGAIAARTKRVRLSSDVCLLPFNHPVRLAEDLAVLDNISNGRIEVRG